jgi:hypothetical protein
VALIILLRPEFSSQGVSADLLDDLAAHVLAHVGSSKETVPQLTESLRKAVAEGAAGSDRRCDVRFHAQPGKLEIVVSANGGRIWQASVPLS